MSWVKLHGNSATHNAWSSSYVHRSELFCPRTRLYARFLGLAATRLVVIPQLPQERPRTPANTSITCGTGHATALLVRTTDSECQYGHSSMGRGNARGKSGCRFQPSIVPPNSSMYVQSMYVCLDIINRLGNMYRNATIPYSVHSPAAAAIILYSRIL